MKTAMIPTSSLGALQAEIERVTHRAVRLGMKAPTLKVHGEAFRLVTGKFNAETDSFELSSTDLGIGEPLPAEHTGRVVACTVVSLESEPVIVGGWTLAGVIEPIDSGVNIIRAVPGLGVDLPERFRTCDMLCEHCNKSRKRSSVIVLRTEGGAGWKAIGRQCVRDYIGHDPALLFAQLSSLEAALASLATFEADGQVKEDGESWGRGGRVELGHPVAIFLGRALTMTKRDGFRKSTESCSTRSETEESIDVLRNRFQAAAKKYLPIAPEEIAEGEKVAAWVLSGALGDGDFGWNAKAIVKSGLVTSRTAGVAASLPNCMLRALGEAKRREAPAASDYVGTVGERLRGLKLSVAAVSSFDTDYGVTYLHILTDERGNTFKWSTGSDQLERGETYEVTGTVKAHGEYRGAKQTVLSRCKAKELKEAAAA